MSVNAKTDKDSHEQQFELELCWCVQQLENIFSTEKLNKRIAEDIAKNIKILKSSAAPLIKKRQVMKMALGDYRSKMKEEENKMSLRAKQIQFTSATPKKKVLDNNKTQSFVRKSAILTGEKDFRFNFNSDATDQTKLSDTIEAENHKNKEFNLNLTHNNDFKFNFVVDDLNDEINLNGMNKMKM